MQQIRFALPAVALLLSLPAVARDAAGFAGEWQMDASRSESAHQATPIGPVTLIITQKADELRIETRRGKERRPGISSETLTYRLDGSESSNAGNLGALIKVKARWDGPKLITETSRNVQGSTVTTMCVSPRRDRERIDCRQEPDRPTRLPIRGSSEHRNSAGRIYEGTKT